MTFGNIEPILIKDLMAMTVTRLVQPLKALLSIFESGGMKIAVSFVQPSKEPLPIVMNLVPSKVTVSSPVQFLKASSPIVILYV